VRDGSGGSRMGRKEGSHRILVYHRILLRLVSHREVLRNLQRVQERQPMQVAHEASLQVRPRVGR
jgi:hypothetical protein